MTDICNIEESEDNIPYAMAAVVLSEEENGIDNSGELASNNNRLQKFYDAVCDSDMITVGQLVTSQNVDVNHTFTEKFIKPWHLGWAAIHICILQSKNAAVEFLVKLGAHTDLKTKSGDTALHIACKYGLTACVEFLLSSNNSLKDCLNDKGLTPIMKAVYRYEQNYKGRYMKVVKLLIEAGCDVNISASSGITPLHLAAEKWDSSIFKVLLLAGANVHAIDSKGKSPLLSGLLCDRVNSEIVKLLIDAGADINIRIANNTGRMPLHLAVLKGYEVCVEHLLKAGADPKCQDFHGRSSLWLAVLDNNMKITPMLVNYGADVNFCSSPQKLSIISLSVKHCSPQLVALLLHLGASVDTETVFGASPLYIAVERNDIEIVKIILNENCDLDSFGNARHSLKPQTPIQVALEVGNSEIIKLLMQAGCRVKEFWIQPDVLSLSIQSDHDLVQWINDYIYRPKSLSFLCILSVRKVLGLGIRVKLDSLLSQNYIPRNLVPNLLLLDILS